MPNIGQSGRGEYVFLLSHGKYRYDAAEYFRIINTANGNADYQFNMVIGEATPEGFSIFRNDQNNKKEHFRKIENWKLKIENWISGVKEELKGS